MEHGHNQPTFTPSSPRCLRITDFPRALQGVCMVEWVDGGGCDTAWTLLRCSDELRLAPIAAKAGCTAILNPPTPPHPPEAAVALGEDVDAVLRNGALHKLSGSLGLCGDQGGSGAWVAAGETRDRLLVTPARGVLACWLHLAVRTG